MMTTKIGRVGTQVQAARRINMLEVGGTANVQGLAAPVMKEMSPEDGKNTSKVEKILFSEADDEHDKEQMNMFANSQVHVHPLALEQVMILVHVPMQGTAEKVIMSSIEAEIARNCQDIAQEVEQDPSTNMKHNFVFFKQLERMMLMCRVRQWYLQKTLPKA